MDEKYMMPQAAEPNSKDFTKNNEVQTKRTDALSYGNENADSEQMAILKEINRKLDSITATLNN